MSSYLFPLGMPIPVFLLCKYRLKVQWHLFVYLFYLLRMSWGHNQGGPGPGPGGPGFNPMGQNQPVHPGSVGMGNPQGGPAGPMGGQQAHPMGQGHPTGPGGGGPAGPQMGHPPNNHQMAPNPNQMGQAQGQMGQGNMGAQQQDIDDPIFQLKKMVPKLKESLHSVMTIR